MALVVDRSSHECSPWSRSREARSDGGTGSENQCYPVGFRAIHFPFVKSGNATGSPPAAMELSESGATAIHVAMS